MECFRTLYLYNTRVYAFLIPNVVGSTYIIHFAKTKFSTNWIIYNIFVAYDWSYNSHAIRVLSKYECLYVMYNLYRNSKPVIDSDTDNNDFMGRFKMSAEGWLRVCFSSLIITRMNNSFFFPNNWYPNLSYRDCVMLKNARVHITVLHTTDSSKFKNSNKSNWYWFIVSYTHDTSTNTAI